MLDWVEVINRSRGLADHCFDVNASYMDAVSITIDTQRCSGAGIGKIFAALQDAHKAYSCMHSWGFATKRLVHPRSIQTVGALFCMP